MNKCKIHNKSGLNIEDQIHSLVDFTQQRFGFKRPPTIFLNDDEENAKKILVRIKRMFTRLKPDKMEGNFLRGFLTRINKKIK